MTFSDMEIQWHPAFCAAAELEFLENQAELDFMREHNLSKKPLQMDLLVVKKLDDVSIRNEIGHIFRKHNVIEYKSPGDGMTIDDFFKTVGYAYLYKGTGKTVDEIPVDSLTVSMFREGRPAGLFRALEKYGLTVEKKYDGIYYVKGLLLPAQIVVTKELADGRHWSLKVLSKNAKEKDIQNFVEEAQYLAGQGERMNVDAILQASVSANHKLYDAIKRRDPRMCEAMRRLMKDEIEEEVREAKLEGVREGKLEGIREGKLEGMREGKLEGKMETAIKMKKKGFSESAIAELLEVGLNIVQQWVAGVASLAK